jgi:hypothetical protein
MRFLVPLENENRWIDLLAVLIATDPVAAARPLRLGNITGRQVTVAREVRAGAGERVDLEVFVDGRLRTVVEANQALASTSTLVMNPSRADGGSSATSSGEAASSSQPSGEVVEPAVVGALTRSLPGVRGWAS